MRGTNDAEYALLRYLASNQKGLDSEGYKVTKFFAKVY
ncbi:MAG: hypothetical protein ACI9DG_002314 [Oleispira sp.]|jgi:hypothetical protein